MTQNDTHIPTREEVNADLEASAVDDIFRAASVLRDAAEKIGLLEVGSDQWRRWYGYLWNARFHLQHALMAVDENAVPCAELSESSWCSACILRAAPALFTPPPDTSTFDGFMVSCVADSIEAR